MKHETGIIIGSISFLYYFGLILYELLDDVESKQSQSSEFVRDMYWTAIILFLIMVIASSSLIYGIVTKRHGLMVPWLICGIIAIPLYCIRFALIYGYLQATKDENQDIVLFSITNCLIIALHILFLYPIYKLYRFIRHTKLSHRGRIISTTGENVPFAAPSAPYNMVQQKI